MTGPDQVPAAAERRWIALCDACHWCTWQEAYQVMEAAAGPLDDPRCPSCARSVWSFHPEDD